MRPATIGQAGAGVNRLRGFRFRGVQRIRRPANHRFIPRCGPRRAFYESPEGKRAGSSEHGLLNNTRRWRLGLGQPHADSFPALSWQNGFNEPFCGKLRDELLNSELFTSWQEAKVVTEDGRLGYNHRRPHNSLEYETPAAYAVRVVGLPAIASPAGTGTSITAH